MNKTIRAAGAALLASALCIVACSPTYNWREVRVGSGALVADLPCKPDLAQRNLPLGGQNVTVDMAGCAVEGVTYLVAMTELAKPEQAPLAQTQWRDSVLQKLQPANLRESLLLLPGPEPHSMAQRVSVQAAAGPAALPSAELAWVIRGTAVYQAAIYGQHLNAAATDQFFSSLRLL